ncbi:protein Bouncer [Cyprinodon tularosa]|uniref:protein Bouncer n=1 Tax=Cyprinodon tularosa TaxID=77115 RepID=UPI0018E257BB|nr:protein Bouncer [Cyprinodon tularosa]
MAGQNVLQLLPLAVLCLHLLLPSSLCENLKCYFTPILEKEKKIELSVTECSPNEVCFHALGHFGNFTALSARGCLPEKNCGKANSIRFRGAAYAMTYECCDWSYCNSDQAPNPCKGKQSCSIKPSPETACSG